MFLYTFPVKHDGTDDGSGKLCICVALSAFLVIISHINNRLFTQKQLLTLCLYDWASLCGCSLLTREGKVHFPPATHHGRAS